jgi:hypothetical protein
MILEYGADRDGTRFRMALINWQPCSPSLYLPNRKSKYLLIPDPNGKRKAGSDVGRSQVSDVLVLQPIPQCCELKNESIILPSASDPVSYNAAGI